MRVHREVAFRTAWLIAGGPDEAEDAAQEGFVKAFHALPRFRPGSPFRPWLLTIVANEARNRRRAAARRDALALRMTEDRRSFDAAPSPETAVLAGERRQVLNLALQRLGEDDRRVLACRWFLELSEAEMASVMAVPRGTVKSRLSRAMGRLREVLATMEATA